MTIAIRVFIVLGTALIVAIGFVSSVLEFTTTTSIVSFGMSFLGALLVAASIAPTDFVLKDGFWERTKEYFGKNLSGPDKAMTVVFNHLFFVLGLFSIAFASLFSIFSVGR